MNSQFQTQDVQQQQQLQGIPIELLRAQQYKQQQKQLIQQQRLLQRQQQRQIFNQQQQILVGQNTQIPLQLQYQLQYQQQQQQQQQQIQRIQLLQKQKQAQLQTQQGIIVSQPIDQASYSNQLLLQAQQNQLLQQQTQLLQQSPQQLPQALLLDAQKNNDVTSQQLLQNNNTLGPISIVNQSPSLNANQTLLQQQLNQPNVNLINQSPIQSLKTTPQIQAQTKLPNSTAVPTSTIPTTNIITNPITTPSSQPQTSFKTKAQVKVNDLQSQSQFNKQSSLIGQIPTSTIKIDSYSIPNSSILNIPTSASSLLTTTASGLVLTSAAVSATATLDAIAKSLPLTTTTTIPSSVTTQTALTSQISALSPLNKSKTSLGLQQLTQTQLQSQLARQKKINQKSPPFKAQANIPISTETMKNQLQNNSNSIKKSVKQTSPTIITKPSPMNLANNKIPNSNRIHTNVISGATPTTTTAASTTTVTTITTPTSTTTTTTTTTTNAASIIPAIPSSLTSTVTTNSLVSLNQNRIPSSSITSITIPTPSSQALNNSLTNPSLQNYQSLLKLQNIQQHQKKLNLTQKTLINSPPQKSSQNIKSELNQSITSSNNDILLSGLTGNVSVTNNLAKMTSASINNNSTTNGNPKNTNINVNTKTKTAAIADSNTITLKTPEESSKINANNDTTVLDNLLSNNKKEPITHININYSGNEINENITSSSTNNIANSINIKNSSTDHPILNSSLLNNSLINSIYAKQPTSLSEKIISKGSFFLKSNHMFSVLRSEFKNRDILFWKQYVNNYFSDKSKIIINLQHFKTIEMKRAIIPQYFDVIAKSEINSIKFSFGTVDERVLGDGSCILEGKDCEILYEYDGILVVWYGTVKLIYDKNIKIEKGEFLIKQIKKFYENNSYIKNNNINVNEYGMPMIIKRFFEIYEVVNKMDDLMKYSISRKLGPKSALNQYVNQYKSEKTNIPLTLNQRLNNLKLNNMSLKSPHLSNSDLTINQQNYNSLLNMDMMPPPQQISSTSNSIHSSLNSNSDNISGALIKKRLSASAAVAATTLSPPSSSINSLNVGANSIAVSNNLLKLNTAMSPISSNLSSFNLPTSSSVLSSLATSNDALSAAGLTLGTSSATTTNSLISSVNRNALSKANINSTTTMKSPMTNLISPLKMEVTEPKTKRLKTNPSPRQRKSKSANSRASATKNRRNSSSSNNNNKSTNST